MTDSVPSFERHEILENGKSIFTIQSAVGNGYCRFSTKVAKQPSGYSGTEYFTKVA